MSDILKAIQDEAHPKPRMIWDGVKLTFVTDVTQDEIDGVIGRLQELKNRIRPSKSGLIVMTVEPPNLKL